MSSRLQYCRVLADYRLNLPRGDVLASTPHRGFFPASVEEIALFVYPGQVTGVEPVVTPCLIRGILLIKVECCCFASLGAEDEFTHLPSRNITVFVINNTKFKPRQRLTHRTYLAS